MKILIPVILTMVLFSACAAISPSGCTEHFAGMSWDCYTAKERVLKAWGFETTRTGFMEE